MNRHACLAMLFLVVSLLLTADSHDGLECTLVLI